MKIIVVGTHQSGSTRVFNLIRLIYEKKGKNCFSCWDYNNYIKRNKKKDCEIIISKIHRSEISLLREYDKVILPLRNFIDSAISQKKRWNRVNLTDSIMDNINLFEKFEKHSNFIFIYEKYSVGYVKEFASFLNVSLTYMEIFEIMKELNKLHSSKEIIEKDDRKKDRSDPLYQKTLLTQHHNTSNGKINKFISDLSLEEIQKIIENKKILNFLEEKKYL